MPRRSNGLPFSFMWRFLMQRLHALGVPRLPFQKPSLRSAFGAPSVQIFNHDGRTADIVQFDAILLWLDPGR